MSQSRKKDFDEGFKRLLDKTDDLIKESKLMLDILDDIRDDLTIGQRGLRLKLIIILRNLREIRDEIAKT